jgi:subtilisin family serine protease
MRALVRFNSTRTQGEIAMHSLQTITAARAVPQRAAARECAAGLPYVARLFLILMLAMTSTASFAQAANPRLQVFLNIKGTVPDWQSIDLTVSSLEVGGIDPTTGKRFLVTAFQGSKQVTIPRTAAGAMRLLVAGPARTGEIDRALVTFSSASLTTQSSGGSPKTVPLVVQGKALKLQPPSPVALASGQTASIAAEIHLGKDAVLTDAGILALKPTLAANVVTPTPEDYLNGDEILARGPTTDLPELGVQVQRSKILDPKTGELRDLTLQKGTGAPVSFAGLRDENETVWRSRHGALNPGLVHKLESLSSSDIVYADLWLRVPELAATFASDAQSPQAWDADHAAFVTGQRAAVAPVAASVSAALSAAGATVLDVDLDPPVIRVRAARRVLEAAIADMADLLEVAETPPESAKSVLMTEDAADMVQEPLFLAHLLLAGTNLRIGLTEQYACINTEHQVFQGVVFEEPVQPCDATFGTSAHNGHSTAVAGALAGYVPPPAQGNTTAPPTGLVGLFQGRMFTSSDCGMINPETIARHPHLINQSCIITQYPGDVLQVWQKSWQRSFDYAVYTHRIFVAQGAGNVNLDVPDTVAVTCPSFNGLCVGGYGPSNTYGPGNFGDDIPTHRWRNDPATHREKPDLVAPSVGAFPHYQQSPQFPNAKYQVMSGTSFSSPFVVGMAALLMANFPKDLTNNPTLTRAVLLGSARHGIPGQLAVPIFTDQIDDRVGAGAPRGDYAREILKSDQFYSKVVDRTADFDTAGYMTQPLSFRVNPQDRVRVVMTYDQCQPMINSVADSMLADLDLIVFENSIDGTALDRTHVNNSHIDNTEMIEFTAQSDAFVIMKIRSQFWTQCVDGSRRTPLAVTWHVVPQ